MKTVYNQVVVRNRKIDSRQIHSQYKFYVSNVMSTYRNRLSNKSKCKPKPLENIIKKIVSKSNSNELFMLEQFIINNMKTSITIDIPLIHLKNNYLMNNVRFFERK